MRSFFILIAGVLLTATAFAGGDGHGGGGVYRNGQYMTFYSAGLYVLPTQLQADGANKVPGLRELMDFIDQTPYLRDETKAYLLNAMEPSFSRKYYEVDDSRFTKKTLATIKAEYAKVVHIGAGDIILYALTDPSNKVTYLLPDFYKLDTKQQEVILYHEADWVLNPNASYKTIVQGEMAFQAFLENPYLGGNLMNWLETAGTHADLLKASIKFDLQTGALAGLLINQTEIPLQTLLGNGFFECKATEIQISTHADCNARIQTNLYTLSKQYPNSMLLRLIRDKFATAGVEITTEANGVAMYAGPGDTLLDDDVNRTIGDPITGDYWNNSYQQWSSLDHLKPFELGFLDLRDIAFQATLMVDLRSDISAKKIELKQYFLVIN